MADERIYEVRYYDAQGHVVKEPFETPIRAMDRWLNLIAAGHKSVKLSTKARSNREGYL